MATSTGSLDLERRAFLGSKHPNSVVTQEGLTILVTKGCIADQAVDAVVNSTGYDFDLSRGALSKILLQRAGPKLQTELTAARPQSLQYGSVTLTKGHGLPAAYVFHGVLRYWNNGFDDAEDVLRALVRNSLIKANQMELKSIAIPAVGTGNLCFPGNLVVDSLFSEADRFSSANPSTTLNEIRFIVYEKDQKVFDAFEQKMAQIKPVKQKAVYVPSDTSDDDDDDDYNQVDIFEHLRLLHVQAKKCGITLNKPGTVYPSSWKPTGPGKQYETTVLDSSDSDFKMVSKAVMETKGNAAIQNILKIERIENRTVYQLYTVLKNEMDKKNEADVRNERTLWHGTVKDSINNICTGGFNRSYCGRNATKYGKGVYFARNFEYSALDTYSKPDAEGTKYVFMCTVLTGTITVGDEQMIEPPEVKPGNDIRYDSTVDSVTSPCIFVVYKDAQAYPQYLVSFN